MRTPHQTPFLSALALSILAAGTFVAAAAAADPMGSAFTYQGRLDIAGVPADGAFDFRFELAFDDQMDSTLAVVHLDDVVVNDGLFSVDLEFNSELFNGNPRWLMVSVREGSHPNGDHAVGSYTSLPPWQSIRPTPFSLYAERAGGLDLPIDAHENILGAPCLRLRNDPGVAIQCVSDDGMAILADTVDGTALTANATGSGWAAALNGKVYVQQSIGIGTASLGGFKLAVNGGAAKPGGGSWSTLSDRRAKHDIVPLTGALATLLALRGMTFEYDPAWIEAGLALPGRQMGFVAQDVQQVLPEWVETLPDGTLCVTERGATALVVEAMRELASRNAALETELRELRAAVQALSRRVDGAVPHADEPVEMAGPGTDHNRG